MEDRRRIVGIQLYSIASSQSKAVGRTLVVVVSEDCRILAPYSLRLTCTSGEVTE